jgi:competence protein ComEC
VLLSWTVDVVRWFSLRPGAQAEFGIDARLALLFYALLIGWGMTQATQPEWIVRLARLVRTRAVLTATLLAGICTVALTGAVAFSRPDGLLHLWLLDVGGYNAVFVQTPGGAQVLVDGGSFPSRLLTALGNRMPFNDREIEIIAITQPDEANFSATRAVLGRYNAGVLLTNGQENLGEAWEELQQAAGLTEQVAVRAGYQVEFGDGVSLDVLHPREAPALEDNLNDDAMVLRLSFGDLSFLLTSDLSEAGQQALLEEGVAPLASVLQLPQGGAALDEVFLAAVQPQVAIAQSDSASHLENADTLALLDQIPQFYTDEDGSIHLYTDGHRLWAVGEPR